MYAAIDDNNYYLAHYGVKGMKWGVRKPIELVGNRMRRRFKKLDTRRNRRRLSVAGAVIGGAAALYAVNRLGGGRSIGLVSGMTKAAIKTTISAGKAAVPKIMRSSVSVGKKALPASAKASMKVGKLFVNQTVHQAKTFKTKYGKKTVSNAKILGKTFAKNLILHSRVNVRVDNQRSEDLGKSFITDLKVSYKKDKQYNKKVARAERKEDRYLRRRMY